MFRSARSNLLTKMIRTHFSRSKIMTPGNECGEQCPAAETQTKDCDGEFDEEKHCVEAWGKWGACSTDCMEDTGKRTRYMEPKPGGTPSNCPTSKKCTTGDAHSETCKGTKQCIASTGSPSAPPGDGCDDLTPLLSGQCCDKKTKKIVKGKQKTSWRYASQI